MTTRELEKVCAAWQDRLKLRDWNISIRVVPKSAFSDPSGAEYYATVWWDAPTMEAGIRIRRGLAPDVAEQTLVHELMHLVLEGHKRCPDGEDNVTIETAIERITSALFQ